MTSIFCCWTSKWARWTDYIAEGHDVEALNYLMKPVDAARLFDVPDKAVAACAAIPGALICNARKG